MFCFTMPSCCYRSPIKCNSVVRLQHVATKKNLHSHYFTSPLSGNQEVSCYGDDDGEGDSGDNWTVVCNNDYWRRDTPVKLKHVDTATLVLLKLYALFIVIIPIVQ